jgi:hypothetical protein
MLERGTRHGARNAVEAFAGADPQKYLLALGSSLPRENDYGSLCVSHASIIAGYNFNVSLIKGRALARRLRSISVKLGPY